MKEAVESPIAQPATLNNAASKERLLFTSLNKFYKRSDLKCSDHLETIVELVALSAVCLPRSQSSCYLGGLLTSHPQRKQRQHSHQKPVGAAWEKPERLHAQVHLLLPVHTVRR
jgi:hypothetical protein